MSDLSSIPVTRKTGEETFHVAGGPVGCTLLEFWQWARSDLLGNTDRGVLAEFIVAMDLGVTERVREGWRPCDLETRNGIKVEVKSSAYLQTWKQKKLSTILFGIGPTHAWDSESDIFDEEKKRQADVYVFCVLAHKDQDTVDPLDLGQWEFYVLATSVLDEAIGTTTRITLQRLVELGASRAKFGEIRGRIEAVAGPTPT